VLRPWREGDQPSLLHLANNRRVWRNLTHAFPHPYTAADADGWIAFARAHLPEPAAAPETAAGTDADDGRSPTGNGSPGPDPGRDLHLAIELDGTAVGGIGTVAGTGVHAATADFGYWLGEPHWGQGLATAAAIAFRQHLAEAHRFARLQAFVFAWNGPSMRVLEKAGFTREGVLRRSISKDGALTDSVVYAFLT
jgi:RimJ/RimL family protein N-acetyltransferase